MMPQEFRIESARENAYLRVRRAEDGHGTVLYVVRGYDNRELGALTSDRAGAAELMVALGAAFGEFVPSTTAGESPEAT